MNIYSVVSEMEWAAERAEDEIKELKARLNNLAELVHYPQHWDTACYPTLESALHDIRCSECRGHQ